MSDLYPITAPIVTAQGADLTQTSVQIAFNTLTAAIRIALNQIAATPTSGPAGGDLSGTYPNPTVAAVHATSGTLDGVTVGGIIPEPGTFTTLSANSLTGLTTALSIAQGGTGATTAPLARTALGAAAGGANSDITSLTGLTTPLPVAEGGTGAITAPLARTALGAAASGANSDITSLTGLTTALSVAQGGTGRQTLTTHGVLVGEGTAAINQLAVGTTGQMLVGATGADPAFGNTISTLTATGAITKSTTAGIVGTTLADNANAGSEGEYITSRVTGVSITTSNVQQNITSISLTAGDWDVVGNIEYDGAGTTTILSTAASISLTSATLAAAPFKSISAPGAASAAGGIASQIAPTTRVNISVTTTVFLVGFSQFSVSTLTAAGYIAARRSR